MAENGQKMKDYETDVRHRVECEERAFHIVNKLLDGKVQAPYLIECGKMISREHYSDIIEERAISHLCGYPLCDNSLANIPKKKYHISTKTNKVYDISERKNFCSNQCLKASKHFSNQIPESPVWTRAREPPADFKLLPHRSIKGIIGDEVVGVSPKRVLEDAVKMLDDLDKKTSSSNRTLKESQDLKFRSKSGFGNVSKDQTVQKENMKSAVSANENEKEDLSNKVPSGSGDISGLHSVSTAEDTAPLEPTLDEAITKLTISEDSCELGQVTKCLEPDKMFEKVDTEFSSHSLDVEKVTAVDSLAASECVTSAVKPGDQERQNEIGNSKECRTKAKEDAHKQSKVDSKDDQSKKMDHLMKLLSSRKSVLSKMVDIQPTVSGHTSVPIVPVQADSHKPITDLEEVTVDNKVQILDIPPSSQRTLPSGSGTQTPSTATVPEKEEKLSVRKKTKPASKSREKPVSLSPLEGIKLVLKRWMTEETNEYLQSSSMDDSQGPHKFSDPRIQRGYMDLCKRLDVQEKDIENIIKDTEEPGHGTDDKGEKFKSPPDYELLKKEAEAFQLRVTEFITGKRPVAEASKKKNDEEEKSAGEVRLPTVDAYDQRQIRIKIVLDRLEKSIPALLTPLCLSLQDVSSVIRELVYTFRLEKDTIVFKPSEWMLIAIFILKMLAQKSGNIAEAFARESAVRYFSIVLKGIGHTAADLDIMTDDILRSCSRDKSSDS